MNTLFKLYYAAWILCLLAFGSVLPQLRVIIKKTLWLVLRRRSPTATTLHFTLRIHPKPIAFVSLFLIFVSVVNGFIHMGTIMTFRRVQGPRPTLDGLAYLQYQSAHEKKLTDWIQKNIKGVPIILEAHGDPYGPYTRVSMRSGLPTWLGWEHHVKQRGTASTIVSTRRDTIRLIYSTPSAEEAHQILKDQRISLVVVGSLERKTYPPEGLDKFENNSQLFERLFKESNEAIYRVITTESPMR